MREWKDDDVESVAGWIAWLIVAGVIALVLALVGLGVVLLWRAVL